MKKKLLMLLMVLALVATSLVGCTTGGNKPAEKEATKADETKKDEPKKDEVEKEEAKTEEKIDNNEKESDGQILFNGSSTLAPVISAIAGDFNEKLGTWDKADASLPKKDIAIYVSSGGSGQGIKAVIDKTADYGMVAREVKDKEKEKIIDYKEYKIGIDALTLAVNPDNPITKVMENLTKEQIVKIFSGEYKTWKDLGASLPEEEIVVITRDINGGAHEVFKKAIMGDVEVKAEAIQAASMGELVKNVIDNKFAIGYASFGVANQNKDKLTFLKVDGVEANKDNIASGKYIIQRPLLIIQSGEPTGEQKAFLSVLLGEVGQKIVEKLGFIPVQ